MFKCWRCVALYVLSLPPILAFVIYRRYAHEEGFQEAMEKLEGGIQFLKNAKIRGTNVPSS
jgi:hypothetical protein